jgi:RNA-directed DNA polymerase
VVLSGFIALATRKGRTGVDKSKPFCISKREVWEAYKRVRANRGAAGVDGQTLAQFDEDLANNLYRIWNRMSSGSYMSANVRRVEIAKSDGRVRPLGVPTVADRIAQMVVKCRLEPLLEPVFHDDSYGYRPGRSAHQALSVARGRCWRRDWVLEIDIKGFFDNIDHELMMRAVRKHTDCRWTLLYIERWLKAGVQMPSGEVINADKGTPQGAVISLLLANLFLHYALDRWMGKHHCGVAFERYADDVICHCESEHQALELQQALERRMCECKLELHPQKTQIVYCRDGKRRGDYPRCKFDFLGYTFKPRRAKTRAGKLFTNFAPAVGDAPGKAMRQMMRRWQVHRRSDFELEEMARWTAPKLKGWVQYYGRFNKSAVHAALGSLDGSLMRWAQRKYKRFTRHPQRAWDWLNRLRAQRPNLFAHWSCGSMARR